MSKLRAFANFVSFGTLDRRQAKKITRSADARHEEAREELEEQRGLTQDSLKSLGELRERIYSGTAFEFSQLYSAIGRVDLTPLKNSRTDLEYRQLSNELISMRDVSVKAKELVVAGGVGVLGGGIAVCGAWGLAGLVGTASTGTAVGTLSGAVATNATLAWLGGGALSAGGAGVTGGMVVLGGVALAPMAIVAMFFGSNKGKQKLDAAIEHDAEVDVLVDRIRTLISELGMVRRGICLLSCTTESLDGVMRIHNDRLREVVVRLQNRPAMRKYLVDPVRKLFRMSLLAEEERKVLLDSVNCACLLRELIDLPVLDEDGGFLSDVVRQLEEKRDAVVLLTEEVGQPQLLAEGV
jgi:hypothetical protein